LRSIIAGRCVRRTTSDTSDIEAFARSVIADPAAHHATPAEADIVASLLKQLTGGAK
jgi:hypothetical protein